MLEDTSSQTAVDVSLNKIVKLTFTKRQLIVLYNILVGRSTYPMKYNLAESSVLIPIVDLIIPHVVESDQKQVVPQDHNKKIKGV